jgi:hypothetical protein
MSLASVGPVELRLGNASGTPWAWAKYRHDI